MFLYTEKGITTVRKNLHFWIQTRRIRDIRFTMLAHRKQDKVIINKWVLQVENTHTEESGCRESLNLGSCNNALREEAASSVWNNLSIGDQIMIIGAE